MTSEPATQPPGQSPSQPGVIRLDIGRITLDGYSPRQRDHFTRALHAELAGRGAPDAAARQAAEAILAAVDAEPGQRGTEPGRRHG